MVIAADPIGREAAQRLARQELAKAIYHPHESFLTWLNDQLGRLFNSTNADLPGGWWALVALIALVVIIAGLVLARVGPVARSRRRGSPGPLSGAMPLSAREHRELAQRLAADGDFSPATLEYVRAIAADLEERAILPPGPGRTADELAADAGRLLPAHADALKAAARLFDDVRYGGRDGSEEGVARLRDTDAAIRATAPTREVTTQRPMPASALP
ncbi:MAG: DUF4129 domain-containing protein [Streptosporangiaceae bacterium]|nr:DUF4129 domain-containing protein [Streptosporangiaceae bacterium]